MTVPLLTVICLLLFLMIERAQVRLWRRRIPRTIAVTGTRGKSSVVRMLASVLRADGRRVLAKTTGSSPRLLLPDGSEEEIRRRRPPSILEQKRLLKRAAALDVDCLVAEVMSIHPENHIVEVQQILSPNVVAVTNSWPDHIDAQGTTESEVARTLCLDIPRSATVFVTSESNSAILEATVRSRGGELVVVEDNAAAPIWERLPKLARTEFPENVELAYAIGTHLGVGDGAVSGGLVGMPPDAGTLSIRTLPARDPSKRLYFINAFAANDPTATHRVLSRVKQVLPQETDLVGLMCLRSDRADRTLQWLEALRGGMASEFSRVYVAGGHASVVARKIEGATQLRIASARLMTETVTDDLHGEAAVFGFGNFVGTGSRLADYWNREGRSYGV